MIRCPSCDHLREFHHDPEGCRYAVTAGHLDANLVCPCALTSWPAPPPEVVVVIAYRDMGVPERAASYAYVSDYYRRVLGCPILVEATTDAPFSRARALNELISSVGGNPVIVQSDPDSLVPADQLHHAISLAASYGGLVIPHDRYLYLTQEATAAVLAVHSPLFGPPLDPFTLGPEDCDTVGRNGSGNVTVFNKTTWRAAKGYDERFGVWGGDDAAFAYACDALVGSARRLHGDMVHLWHPRLPQSVPGHPDYTAQFAILATYRDAHALGRPAVRDLVLNR